MTGRSAKASSSAPGAPASWTRSDRLLCDEMLIGLGRWLRAAGYDTAIAEGRGGDRALLETARREGRTLLTRDAKIMEIGGAEDSTLLLSGAGLGAWAAEIGAALGIEWLKAPFSRCLLCNLPLDAAPEATHALLPESAKALAAEATWCRACAKAYWPGSHVARMRRRLEAWHDGRYS
ncbi:MAG: Mut7-C RNAse domain-containing protein [Alphaproteobacteria bacterium]|nr:Mut7-C RNAse domain-containing protein [Alphaproteobacteria bacterium]